MSKQYLNGIPYGVSMPYRELTQAEYDALPDSKNNDGIMYFIKNSGVAGGIKMFALADIYDTNEREIGVWIDGKPLYQKVIDCNFTIYNTNWYNTQIACPDLDTFIFGGAIDSDNQSWAIIVGTYTNPSKTIGIRMAIVDSGGSNLKKLIIQYTKTTDVPGSGSLTPQGTPTHHYSTDEHVIGTWIDGKPIYERVLHITNPSTNSEIVYQHNIANFNTLVSYEGNAIRADGRSFNIPTLHFTNTEYFITFYSFGDTTCKYYVGSGYSGNSSITNMYLVVRYTKTTD